MTNPWKSSTLAVLLSVSPLAAEPPVAGAPGGAALKDMEQLATPAQVEAFTRRVPRDCYVFGEDRVNSIRRHDALPAHWLDASDASLEKFAGAAQPGEFYVFQLGVYAAGSDLGPVTLSFGELKSAGAPGQTIPAAAFRCFNLGGTDFRGNPLIKEVRVAKGRVQPLWIGVQIPRVAVILNRLR